MPQSRRNMKTNRKKSKAEAYFVLYEVSSPRTRRGQYPQGNAKVSGVGSILDTLGKLRLLHTALNWSKRALKVSLLKSSDWFLISLNPRPLIRAQHPYTRGRYVTCVWRLPYGNRHVSNGLFYLQQPRLETASRQKTCCFGLASTFWCFASVSMLWPLSYVTISLFITFIHSSLFICAEDL